MFLANGTFEELYESTKGKEIICFGAGKCLNRFLHIFSRREQIKAIVDNDSTKWGQYYCIESYEIPIVSIDNAIAKYSDFVMIITMGQKGLYVLKQLHNISLMSNKTVWWSLLLGDDSKPEDVYKMDKKFQLSDNQIIPKIIHYCWFGKSNVPGEFQKYIDGWKRLCPDYEIRCWNESNYDVSKNAYMKKAYEDRVWGFVPDYARKDIIYNYGGIYLDTDVELIKKPDDLLYQEGFCGREGTRVNFGLGFGARAGLPIIKELRDMYDDIRFVKDASGKIKIGPEHETDLLKKYGLKSDGSYQIIEGLTVYPTDVLSGVNKYSGIPYMTNNTVTIHHYAGTWLTGETIRLRKKIQSLCTLLVNSNNCLEIDGKIIN